MMSYENCSCEFEDEKEIDNVSQRSEESNLKQDGILHNLKEPKFVPTVMSQSAEVYGTSYTSKDGTK